MIATTFLCTDHAPDNLIDRGIDRAPVERTITEPETVEPDPVHSGRMRAYRALPERGGRIPRVVHVEEPASTDRIITLSLDRGWRRRHEGQVRPEG